MGSCQDQTPKHQSRIEEELREEELTIAPRIRPPAISDMMQVVEAAVITIPERHACCLLYAVPRRVLPLNFDGMLLDDPGRENAVHEAAKRKHVEIVAAGTQCEGSVDASAVPLGQLLDLGREVGMREPYCVHLCECHDARLMVRLAIDKQELQVDFLDIAEDVYVDSVAQFCLTCQFFTHAKH